MAQTPSHAPRIIPVASGKGGVGKSLITAGLSRALAAAGHRTVAVDLDLGGSNLHAYFGLGNDHPGIGDYVESKGVPLAEFSVAIDDNLGFIPGDGVRPFLANLHHGQKLRLLRDLQRLPADIVLLDLGAGSSFNNLDFFRDFSAGLVVTGSGYTAIMNMMNFLKHVALRVVAKGIGKNTFMQEIVDQAARQTMSAEMVSIPDIVDQLAALNSQRAEAIRAELAALRPRLLVNMLRDLGDLGFIDQVTASLHKRLGIEVEWIGTLLDEEGGRWHWPSLQAPHGALPRLTGINRIAPRLTGDDLIPETAALRDEAGRLWAFLHPPVPAAEV